MARAVFWKITPIAGDKSNIVSSFSYCLSVFPYQETRTVPLVSNYGGVVRAQCKLSAGASRRGECQKIMLKSSRLYLGALCLR